jgi:hypothetical protein
VPDKVEPTYRTLAIAALSTFGPARRGNEVVLLIKPDGWDFYPGEFGERADANISHEQVPLEPLVARDSMLRERC